MNICLIITNFTEEKINLNILPNEILLFTYQIL